MGIWGVVALAGLLGWYAYDLPSVDQALIADRRPTITIAAANGTVVTTRGDKFAGAVRVEDLPPALPDAILSTEDRRFYSHFGLDPIGLARAMWSNLWAGRVVQGGSTLTQQVAKNLFLSPERSLKRKIQELMLALWLEHEFTKDQILTIYLNRVYLGAGTYGVEAAARTYFGKSARHVTLPEAALLAGLLKAPSRYNPRSSPERAAGRARQVLLNMVAAGTLDKAAADRAAKRMSAVVGRKAPAATALWFGDWVVGQLGGYTGHDAGDLTIITTLNNRLQKAVENIVARHMNNEGRRRGASQVAVVVLNHEGALRALIGGKDYAQSQFNRATLAKRQPGSAFKPFVYLAGLETGLTPETVMDDKPIKIGDWEPGNWDDKFRGAITLTEALADSVNTVAVRVARRAGPAHVTEVAERLGITTPLPDDLGLALGSAEVTLMDLVTAYVPLANGGFGVFPHGITEIRDRAGQPLYRRSGGGIGAVVQGRHLQALRKMMIQVMKTGTGKNASFGNWLAAGKTGTSQDYRDAWFVGFTGELVAGVWVGNDDGRPMKGVTGGGLPARIWKDIMRAGHKGLPLVGLPAPASRAPISRERTPSAPDPQTREPDLFDAIKSLFGG
ncbi:GT51 : b-glycosyltransferase/PBP transpeptidase (candidate murein polymerase) [Magnetospira sp. QH-2]|nr:GT51 : b-glycosyltransferase/PBP transpeptidase (candidate murein polymerase) [Magnetospira sp. QH-2]